MWIIWLDIILLLGLWLTSLRSRYWVIQGLRAQIKQLTILAGICTVAVCLGSLSPIYKLIIVCMCIPAVLYTKRLIFPFTKFAAKEVPDARNHDNHLCCLSLNVRMANRAYQKVSACIAKNNPDLILLTEVDVNWITQLNHLKEEYPHHIEQPLNNTYGMALFSKLPITSSAIKFMVDEDVPSIHAKVRWHEKTIQVIGLHPKPPAPDTKHGSKDLELLLAAGMTNDNTLPTIVTGDLNDVAWSPTTQQFKDISRLKDPRIGRGLFYTYNVFVPFFRMPIDHFFVSEHFAVHQLKRLKSVGSDHFPMLIKLGIVDQVSG